MKIIIYFKIKIIVFNYKHINSNVQFIVLIFTLCLLKFASHPA